MTGLLDQIEQLWKRVNRLEASLTAAHEHIREHAEALECLTQRMADEEMRTKAITDSKSRADAMTDWPDPDERERCIECGVIDNWTRWGYFRCAKHAHEAARPAYEAQRRFRTLPVPGRLARRCECPQHTRNGLGCLRTSTELRTWPNGTVLGLCQGCVETCYQEVKP